MHVRALLVGVCLGVGCVQATGAETDVIDDGTSGDGKSDDGTSGDGSGPPSSPPATPRLPPADAAFDYQLGGAYALPPGVQIVSRDREAAPAPGAYSICYVNGFQIQPHEEATWLAQHPELILRTSTGQPVIDPDWDEMLIDIGTPAKRTAVAAVIAPWIEACAQAGFDAIEIDNLDTYARSGGRLTEDDAVAMMALFSEAAHSRGLASAQKNAAEMVDRRAAMGTDFAISEECGRYQECDDYIAAYGDHVIVIEYRQADFASACAAWPGLSIVLRDRDLVTPAQSSYRFAGC